MVRFHVNFPGCSGWKTSLTFWNGPFLPDILVFWESNLKRKPFQIGSTSYREIHGPLVLSLISTVFTHRSRAHVRLLLGSCIVAQTMVLDEPNWRDWTEAHICHVVTVEMVHHLKCQICRFTWKKIRTMWLGLLLFQLKKYVRQIHVWLFWLHLLCLMLQCSRGEIWTNSICADDTAETLKRTPTILVSTHPWTFPRFCFIKAIG